MTARKIGKYQILEMLGEGGMGVVYKAFDPLMEREVAIKVLLERAFDLPEIKERFYREARSAGRLSHENITIFHDLGETDGKPFIVMEFLTGTDLRAIIKGKTHLSLQNKLDYARQICNGLGYSHSKDIIHRDIKPENIRVLDDGKIKIMDFGIAKPVTSTMTQTGTVMGTPFYMSPEQIKGIKVDHRSDIFSFGVVLYELITYQLPFPGDNPTTVYYKIVNENPEPIPDVGIDGMAGVRDIILKCLQKEPKKRYQNFGEVAKAIDEVLERLKREEQRQIQQRKQQAEKLVSEAKKFLAKENFSRALEVAGQAREIDADYIARMGLIEEIKRAEEKLKIAKIVDQGLKSAKKLLKKGQYFAAQDELQQVLKVAPQQPEAQQLLQQASEQIKLAQQEQEIAKLLAEGKELLSQNNLEKAEEKFNTILEHRPGHAEASRLLNKIQNRKLELEAREKEIRDKLEFAKKCINDADFAQAVSLLNDVLRLSPDEPQAEKLLIQAQKDLQKQQEIEKKAREEVREKARIVEQDAINTVVIDTRTPVTEDVPRPPKTTVPKPRKSPKWLAMAAVLVLFIAGGVTYRLFFYTPAPPLGHVSLNVLPWAEITKIENQEGGEVLAAQKMLTPCQLSLPEGRYNIHLSNPDFNKPLIVPVDVTVGSFQEIKQKMPDFDYHQILADFKVN